MRFSSNYLPLIAICWVLLAFQIHGELIMIRHSVKKGEKIVQDLTCMSEDDGSALIWNGKGIRSVAKSRSNDSSHRMITTTLDRIAWKKVTPIKISMAPVFDYRWEGFPEYNKEKLPPLWNLKDNDVVVFYARGLGNIPLELKFANNKYIKIELPGSVNTDPMIQYYFNSTTTPENIGSMQQSERDQSFSIKELEWRTYVIQLKNHELKLFYGTQLMKNASIKNFGKVESISVKNLTDSQTLRYHDYPFLWTNKIGEMAVLSPIECAGDNLSVELIVSLCPECKFEVSVLDQNSKSIKNATYIVPRKDMDNGLRFWQIEKLNFFLPFVCNKNEDLSLRIVAAVNQSSDHGELWWAFGSSRRSIAEKTFRKSPVEIERSNNTTEVTCQKLSYAEKDRSVIYSNSKITDTVDAANLHRYLKDEGEICNLENGDSCEGISICNKDGCVCSPGFKGDKCDQKLDLLEFECNGVTGLKLKKLPIMIQKNGTEGIKFQIKKEGAEWSQKKIISNSSDLLKSIIKIEMIKPQMKYRIRAVVEGIEYPETSFNTSCWQHYEPYNFSAIPKQGNNIILKWKYNQHSWRKTKKFEVTIDLLNSTSKGNRTLKFFDATNCMTSSNQTALCCMNISLPTPKSYIFRVKAMDEFDGNSSGIIAWYLARDELDPAITNRSKINDKIESLSVNLSSLGFTSEESIVNVILKIDKICPDFDRTQNPMKHVNTSDTTICWSERLKTGEYQAWPMALNETNSFLAAIEENNNAKLHFIWLILIPISAACFYYYLKLRPKYMCNLEKVRIRSPPNNYTVNARLQPIEEPEEVFDNHVPQEVQRFKKFENYVRRAAEDGVLEHQFASLRKLQSKRSCECGKLPGNKRKNRYGNLIAYDETRVLLMRNSNDPNSDYINASFVQGYCKEKAYIATQGPLPETVDDFWRMIWQEEVRIICMLVDLYENGKKMCERYWPEVGEKICFGDIVILTTNQRISVDYTYRTFLVSTRHELESRMVHHLQYTGWPDEGVPMYSHSVVEYLQKMLSVAPGQGPIVVHCSSGAGRTGTIILSDIVMRHLAAEGTVDVFAEAKKMYSARANMIGNYSQYVLTHLVPTQCLLMLPTKVLCSDITEQRIEEMKQDIPAQIARLEECAWMDKALHPLESIRPPNPENILKNRFPKFRPVGPHVVTLKRYPAYDTNSGYISAISVNVSRVRKQYIASQLPMPSTLTDFWRLIVEKNIELIIILQKPSSQDETCCPIVPHRRTVVPVPYLKVETKTESTSNKYFETDKLLLTDTSQEPARTRTLTIFTYKYWHTSEGARPPPPKSMVELWLASEKIQREGPPLVLCYNGVTGCGLFMALNFMLERMAVEQECDVGLAVRAVRRSRQEFVSSEWQFEYLYDGAVKYVEMFQDYDNFSGALRSPGQLLYDDLY